MTSPFPNLSWTTIFPTINLLSKRLDLEDEDLSLTKFLAGLVSGFLYLIPTLLNWDFFEKSLFIDL